MLITTPAMLMVRNGDGSVILTRLEIVKGPRGSKRVSSRTEATFTAEMIEALSALD